MSSPASSPSAVVPRLDLVGGRPVTTSLNVAEVFGKQHQHVLRAIRLLDVPDEFNASNFGLVEYRDAKGEIRPMYNITRDGFTLLAMGFTGKAAMRFKLAYIEAFNRMEAELAQPAGKRADIFHHRGPVSDSGLDIRYTLDLTKILTRPTRTSLTLLQRLTGIEMDDLVEDALHITPGREVETSLDGFLNDCTRAVPDPAPPLTLALMHRAYLHWCLDHGLTQVNIATSRELAARLRDLGYTLAKVGGRIQVFGLTVREVA